MGGEGLTSLETCFLVLCLDELLEVALVGGGEACDVFLREGEGVVACVHV